MTRSANAPRLSRRALGGVCGLVLTRWHQVRARESDVDALVTAMTLRERAARMFMFPISGTVLSAEDGAWLGALKPAGVILVGSNFGTPEEVKFLVAAIHATNPELPPLVALDQEGGIVSRIADDPAPDAPTMGQLPAVEISALARARAERLAAYGFDVNFAPVADVAFTPDSFMTGRAFGDDPAVVARDVAAYLSGVAGTGVLHAVKHFPGRGRGRRANGDAWAFSGAKLGRVAGVALPRVRPRAAARSRVHGGGRQRRSRHGRAGDLDSVSDRRSGCRRRQRSLALRRHRSRASGAGRSFGSNG